MDTASSRDRGRIWAGACACLLLVGLLAAVAPAGDRFVSPDGRDTDPGTEARPFRTFRRAIQGLAPGDTCYLRGGRYTEPLVLSGLKGAPGRPITFVRHANEEVVLDGTVRIRATWRKWKGNIYRATLDRDVWQLFVGNKLVQVARWPNAGLSDGSVWHMEASMRCVDRGEVKGNRILRAKSRDGLIYDRNPEAAELPDAGDEADTDVRPVAGRNRRTLAETGIDFTGAVAVLNVGHWLTWARRVEKHGAGSDHFTYDSRGTSMKRHCAYYMLGLPCLDRPNEWWYDKETKAAYLYPADGADPNRLDIRGKVRDYSLRAAGCEDVVFRGLTFFGSAMAVLDCRRTTFEDCRLLYPSTNKFMLGRYEWFAGGRISPEANCMPTIADGRADAPPGGNAVRNCVIEYANSPLYFASRGITVENCLIHDVEWDCNAGGGSGSLLVGRDAVVRRNTIHTCGNSEGVRCGAGATVELNHIRHMGLLQHDGAAVNVGATAQEGTVLRYNWVHDTRRQGLRFDSTTGRAGRGGSYHHNVIWRTSSNVVKGDMHLIYNNTIFDCGALASLQVRAEYGDVTDMNRHTILRNNLVDVLASRAGGRNRPPVPAIADHNIVGPDAPAACLRDIRNLDFRPKPSSAAVDAGAPIRGSEIKGRIARYDPIRALGKAPDVGAYEHGANHYWIPGRQLRKASFPVPPDGARGVRTDAALMWLEGSGAVSHQVYLGVDRGAVLKADRSSAQYAGGASNGNVFVPVKRFRRGTAYYWRVDAVEADGAVVRGDVWRFSPGDDTDGDKRR